MRDILKIEPTNTVKRLAASLIDIMIVVAAAFAFIFGVFYTSFNGLSDMPINRDYINSVEIVENNYSLQLDNKQDFDVYLKNAKNFFLTYEKQIVKSYLDGAEENKDTDKELYTPEFIENLSHIEFIYNIKVLGLPLKPNTTDEKTYKNSYFQYKIEGDKVLIDEFGIDNPAVSELNQRGIMNRRNFCYNRYQICQDLLNRIDVNYRNCVKTNDYYHKISYFSGSLISVVIFYLIIPLCLGNYATLGKKVFNYGYINENGTKLSWWKGILKTLIATPLMLFSCYTINIVTFIIFTVAPYALCIITFLFSHTQQDFMDKILKMRLVDVKNSLIFKSEQEENEYFESSDEEIDQEEKDYTDLLNNMSELDVKSIEEKIEDEQTTKGTNK